MVFINKQFSLDIWRFIAEKILLFNEHHSQWLLEFTTKRWMFPAKAPRRDVSGGCSFVTGWWLIYVVNLWLIMVNH